MTSKNVRVNDENGLNRVEGENEWKKYFDIAQKLTKPGDSIRTNLTISSLMGNKLDDFERYVGSLTTPHCTEKVVWNVFKEPVCILDYEFKLFRHGYFFESYRGPQPLYYRTVHRSFMNTTESDILINNYVFPLDQKENQLFLTITFIELLFY